MQQQAELVGVVVVVGLLAEMQLRQQQEPVELENL
jgi:hypothetical protein